MLAKKGDNYNVVLHWYQAGGDKVLASGIQQNLQRFIGLIRDNRNDGAFVRISMITKENACQDAFGHSQTLFRRDYTTSSKVLAG